MDLKINIGNALSTTEAIVEKEKTPRELLTERNIAFGDGNVMLDGEVLGTQKLNTSLEDLGITDGSYLTVTSKQDSGNKAL